MKRLGLCFFCVFVAAGTCHAAGMLNPSGPEDPEFVASFAIEGGLTYGETDELPLPKTILFTGSPDSLLEDAAEWKQHGMDAFFVHPVVREWSGNIWGQDGKPWTIGESDELFQKVKGVCAICEELGQETFLKIAFDHTFEWFNDVAWQQIDNNFKQFAIFARDGGCTGIALDIEYIGEQYSFTWEGYDYDWYSRKDLVEKVRKRMTRVLGIMYDEFPEMVFLTFPEQWLGMGANIHVAWIEEAARRDAPGGVHYCLESTYRTPDIRHAFARAWGNNEVFQRLLSDRGRAYWMEKCTIASGVWPLGDDADKAYRGPVMSLDQFRQAIAGSLMMSPRYSWIYGSRCISQLLGRDLDEYDGPEDLQAHLQIIADKEMVIDRKYVELAKRLRAKERADYSAELGLKIVPQVHGPRDEVRVAFLAKPTMNDQELEKVWDLAIAQYSGEIVDWHREYGTQTNWMVIGPFPNEGVDFKGHDAVYGPEESLDLDLEYDGVNGKVGWFEYRQDDLCASVELKKLFEEKEHVCAYALCYVTAPEAVDVQMRVGTNDAGKVWLGGDLVLDYPYESGIIIDKEVVPVTLPKGTTPVLLKVSNGVGQWGFVFRITDGDGNAVEDLEFSLRSPE